jgi:adenine-specific DNA methylase
MRTYFNKIKVQGLMISLEFERNPKADVKDFLKTVKKYTERVLVWVKCPRCGWDVPAIDMTKDGYCYYCYVKGEGASE